MKKQDYTAAIVVKATPEEAFTSINHVSAWWTENLEGSTKKLGDVFTVTFGETFVTFKKIEDVPGQKAVWLVTDSFLHWQNDKTEWTNTKISFEVSEEGGSTVINFTHTGLMPEVECYNNCVKGWNEYIKGSLYKLITEGKGKPQPAKKQMAAAEMEA
jgi:hypothetical protein